MKNIFLHPCHTAIFSNYNHIDDVPVVTRRIDIHLPELPYILSELFVATGICWTKMSIDNNGHKNILQILIPGATCHCDNHRSHIYLGPAHWPDDCGYRNLIPLKRDLKRKLAVIIDKGVPNLNQKNIYIRVEN